MFIKYEIIMSKNTLKASRIPFFNDFLNHYLQNIKCQSKIFIVHNYRMLRINEIRIKLHAFIIHAKDLYIYIYNILSHLILFEKQNCKMTVIFNRFIFAFLFFVYCCFSFSYTHAYSHIYTHTNQTYAPLSRIAISRVIAAQLRD